MRFSNDKTPYKTGFSASFSRSGRKGIFAHCASALAAARPNPLTEPRFGGDVRAQIICQCPFAFARVRRDDAHPAALALQCRCVSRLRGPSGADTQRGQSSRATRASSPRARGARARTSSRPSGAPPHSRFPASRALSAGRLRSNLLRSAQHHGMCGAPRPSQYNLAEYRGMSGGTLRVP